MTDKLIIAPLLAARREMIAEGEEQMADASGKLPDYAVTAAKAEREALAAIEALDVEDATALIAMLSVTAFLVAAHALQTGQLPREVERMVRLFNGSVELAKEFVEEEVKGRTLQ